MKSRIQILLIIFLCLAMVMPWPLTVWAEPIPLEKEQKLGQLVHLKISAADKLLIDDPIVNKYYRSIADRVLKGAGLRSDQYNFYIVNRFGLTVFTVPDGYIYMYPETIINLENEGQLASLLAHEMAHLTSRHYIRLMEADSSISMNLLSDMILAWFFMIYQGGRDVINCHSVMMSSGMPAILTTLINSREDEIEADDKGLQYLTKAGYNPRDMYDSFKIMATKTSQVHKDVPTYLTIHPDLIGRLTTTFKKYENSSPSPPDLKYQAFRDRVTALAGHPNNRVRIAMIKRLEANKNDHSTLHALGLLDARQRSLTQADKLMKQALSLDPGNSEYLADLGDLALRQNKPTEAKEYYEQAVLGLARASELLGENSLAATLYDRAINMDTALYPEALELAGRFFERIGQPAKANYYLGRYFTSRGNIKQAIIHYQETAKSPEAGQYEALANGEIDILTELTEADNFN